jgi:DNA adenine methylase
MEALERPGRIIAFKWQGGKFRHLKWLLPLLPPCDHYVEPFGGAGSVLLNREPGKFETLNDINGEVVNFFRVLREHRTRLIDSLSLTPWSREEFELSLRKEKVGDLERARRFVVRTLQGYMGADVQKHSSSWSHNVIYCKHHLHTFTTTWTRRVEQLVFVAARLKSVQLEHRPALKVIENYDTPGTLFYCDPPYLMDTRTAGRCYAHEMGEDDYGALAEALNRIKGRAAVSCYEHPLMKKLFPAPRWRLAREREKYTHGGAVRQECLLTNYDPPGDPGRREAKNGRKA